MKKTRRRYLSFILHSDDSKLDDKKSKEEVVKEAIYFALNCN